MKDLNLDEVIVGRVEPHIYAFTTNTIPNYLKVGDTYRTVKSRLEEWKKYFPNLKPEFEGSAKISDDVFFRDFAVHDYLENGLHRERLTPAILKRICSTAYFSKEFFKDATPKDVREALQDIQKSYADNDNRYSFYNLDRMPVLHEYRSTGYWNPRPNQQATIDRFKEAIAKGRTNLLMYAVMRFGKSFTSLCCAKEMKAKIVLVVSAKADVKEEWRKNVQSADNFRDDYKFLDADSLTADENIIKDTLRDGKGVVLFLTLQDLQGEDIKSKHKEVFDNKIDLLIVDETHYGARAEKYGAVLRQIKDIRNDYSTEDFIDIEEADNQVKSLNAKITLHLSGTPYRILMGSEFKKEDIIAFYQFTDIVKEQEDWDKENILKDDADPEWANPYFGFPQMIRFAFHPSAATKAKLDELRKNGVSYAFSELFKPKSISRADDDSHKLFVHEAEILDLFTVIDGSKNDKNVLGFLNLEKIKKGNMCRHIVCVLPYCASCDALEKLIHDNEDKFKNLNEYEIINISGVDSSRNYRDVNAVKRKIKECEDNNKKTLTLTVNRMLTGSTVEEWDTMIFLKDTASPQDYDQAVFRLQNQYVRKYKDPKSGQEIKYNMKPQTLLVDFDPNRMFIMQESKSQIYNVNTEVNGNAHLQDRIREELRVSPIITINQNKIGQVDAADIIDAVSEYSSKRGVWDESKSIPVDFELLKDQQIFDVINSQGEIGSNQGLKIEGNTGNDVDIDVPPIEQEPPQDPKQPTPVVNIEKDDMKSLENKFKTYYSRILFFAFLTENKVLSLDDILSCITNENNARIAKNLGLKRQILVSIRSKINSYVLQQLDYKIYDISKLAHDTRVEPIKRAETALIKFGRFSESEVPTPINVCDDMINLIPDDAFLALRKKNNAMLDIASKAGEFAIAICKRCAKLGIKIETIKDSVLAIPTSSIAYEFTRKVYEFLGLDIDTIATEFTSYDLLEIKVLGRHGRPTKEIDYERVAAILKQTKPLDKIKLNDNIEEAGENKMQFQAVVGNPPYQVSKTKTETQTQTNSSWIYQYFQFVADDIARCSCVIYPFGGWFDAPERLNGLGNRILTDKRTITVRAYEGTTDKRAWYRKDKRPDPVFGPEVNLSAGVSIVLRNNKKHDGFIYSNRIYSDKEVFVPFERTEDITPNPMFIAINNKLIGDKLNCRIKKGIFGIESDFVEKNPDKVSFNKQDWKDPIQLLTNDKSGSSGRARLYWTDKSNLEKGQEYTDFYKILMASAYPKKTIVSGELSVLNVKKRIMELIDELPTHSAFGRSRLALFMSKSKTECENFKKYLQTTFFAGLVLQEPNRSSSFGYVIPDQDFTNKSDIDWAKPIAEIDKQLYKKYGLDKKEIDFIESMIKPME